jgi:hypothetical protein
MLKRERWTCLQETRELRRQHRLPLSPPSSVNRAENHSPPTAFGGRSQTSIPISAIVSHDDQCDPSGSTTRGEVRQLAAQQNGVREEAGAEGISATVESGVASAEEVAGANGQTDAPRPGAQTTSHDDSCATDTGVAGPARPAGTSITTTADTAVASAAASAADAHFADETTLINEASASDDHNNANADDEDDDDATDDIKARRRRQEPAIDADPDRALTHLCARIMADLDGWNGDRAALDEQIRAALQPRSSGISGGSGGSGGGGYTAAFLRASVRDSAGKLWEARVDVSVSDLDGWSAYNWATHKGHSQAAKLLLDARAKVRAADKRGWRSLSRVAKKPFPE